MREVLVDADATNASTQPASRDDTRDVGAVIVGAGPAGLATARELGERGVSYRILEKGHDVAHVWRNLYESLRLHTGRHLSALPGLKFPQGTPLFPSRSDFVDYLTHYAETFGIRVETGIEVLAVTPLLNPAGWSLTTSGGKFDTNALVVATGIVSNPRVPEFEGRERFRGEIMHSVEYKRPDAFREKRVLVVGCGNSGGEIASELATNDAEVTISVRSGANVVPLTLLGVPIQYLSVMIRKLPRPAQDRIVRIIGRITELRRGPHVLPRPAHSPLDAIPLIGFHLVDEIRAGRIRVRPGIRSFTATGVRFEDGEELPFDVVILATGFRAALQPFGELLRTDAQGFAMRSDRVTSADQKRLWFVGHNYSAAGGIQNIRIDAPLVADRVAQTI
jgi:cation diffusion facilitator CzcD-associated flavoprotein CzcO